MDFNAFQRLKINLKYYVQKSEVLARLFELLYRTVYNFFCSSSIRLQR